MRFVYIQFSGAKKHARQTASYLLNVAGAVIVAGSLLLASQYVRRHTRVLRDFIIGQTRPRKLALYAHDVYNDQLKQQLERHAIQRIANASLARLDPQELFSELTERFGVVERIQWHMPRPLFAQVHVYGTKPIWRLGSEFVIGSNNKIYAQEQFSNYPLATLPKVSFTAGQDEEQVSPEIMHWLKALPEVITAQFDVQYVSSTQVRLCAPNGRLVVTALQDQLYDTKKLAAVTQLYGQRSQQQRELESWHYDIRFNNQVVATKHKLNA